MNTNYIFDFEKFKKSKPKEVQKIYEHVAQVTVNKMSYNAQRDKTDQSRNLYKNLVGKIAEYAVFAYIFYSATTMVTKLDLNIYEYGDVGCDLKCTGATTLQPYNIHVKSCTIQSQNEFGLAWLFRNNEQLVACPKENDVIVLTRERNDNKIEIVKIIRATDVKSYSPALTSNYEWIESKCKLTQYKLEDNKIPDFVIV